MQICKFYIFGTTGGPNMVALPAWVKRHYVPLELYSAPGAGPQKVYQTSIGQGYKGKGNNNEGGFTKLKTSKRYK